MTFHTLTDIESRTLRELIDQASTNHATDAFDVLVHDRHWAIVAHAAMQRHKTIARETSGRWAPVMVPHRSLSATLKQVIDLVEDLARLQAPITVFAQKGIDSIDAAELDLAWRELQRRTAELRGSLVQDRVGAIEPSALGEAALVTPRSALG